MSRSAPARAAWPGSSLSVALLGASCCMLLVSAGGQKKAWGRASALKAPAGATVTAASSADVNGDGIVDAIIASAGPEPFARRLSVYFARESAQLFGPQPELTLDLTPDVVAWTAGDVDPAPGQELVLFNARGAFAWRPGEPAETRFVRLVEVDFLWQLPDPLDAFVYDRALVDLDLDGLLDLVLPEPGGYRIALQRRSAQAAAFTVVHVLRLPDDAEAAGLYPSASGGGSELRGQRRTESDIQVKLGFAAEEDAEDPPTLLDAVEKCPAPHYFDWNADERADLIAQGRSDLFVWEQGEGSRFETEPTWRLPLPVVADRSRRLDASYSSHALELNGDGRADMVIFAGDKRSDSVRTQMMVFLNGAAQKSPGQSIETALFGPRGIPQQLLVLAGFVGSVTFDRVNADGLPDLVVRGVRPDLIDQIRSASSESIEVDFYVYLNQKGTFPKRPDVTWTVTVALRNFDLTLRFVGDVNGDRLSELLVRDMPERLRLVSLRARRGGLEVLPQAPLFELEIDPEAVVRIKPRGAGLPADVMAVEEDKVWFVRFGR